MSAFDEFDFDVWAALAKEDPEKFELMRRRLLERQLEASPAHLQKRLEGLQWRLDKIRDHSGSPMGACVRMSRMMWDAVLGTNGLVENLKRLSEVESEQELTGAREETSATVFQFPKDPTMSD